MLLSELISDLQARACSGDTAVDITGIVYDSRKAVAGSLFVAIKGENNNGHEYAASAARNGAAAIVAEREIDGLEPSRVPLLIVNDSRKAMASLSAKFHGFPSRKLKLIGVTGTKGKTTTTYLISNVLEFLGLKSGVIGTIGSRVGDTIIGTEHTTPESADLQPVLARMVELGAQWVAIEVSSHGLVQHRVGGCEFDCGVFTNLTRDHLDYHLTMEDYLAAKLLLFRGYAEESEKEFTAVVNADDSVSQQVIDAAKGRVITFGVKSAADITARDIETSATGARYKLSFRGHTEDVDLKLGGMFNIYNSLAAAGALLSQGLSLSDVAHGLAVARNVPGRFESVDCGQDFAVVVDYAHAPDALRNVLEAARDLTEGRLIVVFGCGGNRDKGKRPMMGAIAADLADLVVVTSDNPRKEDPAQIIREIIDGIDKAQISRIIVEEDRREAIRAALGMASSGDMVVVAGKGHEDYQIFADRTIHFDDREVVRDILCEKAGRA
jgi:UDP-N-acetylmuramoyl-L-alanyl-D-glutamate--2,6-diaminopimelate ligase